MSFAHFIDIVLVVQLALYSRTLSYVAYVFDEDEMLRWFHEEEEEDEWLIQNEFVGNFSSKISTPPAHRICGFNLFARFCVTSEFFFFDDVGIEIRNNTSGQSMCCQSSIFAMSYKRRVREFQSIMHRKLGADDPTFDNGDDVSISVIPHCPAFQVRTIGVRWLHEEEGNDDDIQSKDEVIHAHNSRNSLLL